MTVFFGVLLTYSVTIILITIIVVGFLAVLALLLWLSEWLLNQIASFLKVHKEFGDFLRHKYLKKALFKGMKR